MVGTVYDPSMPDNLPAHLLALRSVQSALQAGLLGLRVALVALVWLAIVPWMSIWTFRCVFSSLTLWSGGWLY